MEQDITDAAKAAAAAAKEAKKGTRARSKSPKGGRKGSGRQASYDPIYYSLTNVYISDTSLVSTSSNCNVSLVSL